MNVKLTINQILASGASLDELAKIQLPVKISYAIAKALRVLQPIRESASAMVNACIKRLGEIDPEHPDNGPVIKRGTPSWDTYVSETDDMLTVEEEVNIHTINLSELLKANIELSANTLMILDFLIVDDTTVNDTESSVTV